jgi:hypothetical protein
MAKAPPVVKKSGIGCCGCGCILLALVAALFLGLVIGATYLGNTSATKITSATPPNIPTFDGGDDVYNGAQQKLKDFDHDVHDHLGATIHLSADEINTMIARNPGFTGNHIRLYVSFNGDLAQVQTSVPTNIWTKGYFLKDRYLSGDMSFRVNFDSDAKTVNLDLQSLALGQMETPKDNLPSVQSILNPMLNQSLQKDSAARNILAQATSIQITKGELVIETK